MALIYFAHPIDYATLDDHQLVARMRDELQMEGLSIYTPAQAWSVRQPFDKRVQRINEMVLRQADCVVAILPEHSKSRGVPAEIQLAIEVGVPVVLLHSENSRSMIEYHWENEPAVYVYGLDDAPAAAWRAMTLAVDENGGDDKTAYFIGPMHQLQKAHEGDAGFDLWYNGHTRIEIPAGSMARIPTGVHIQMPRGMYAIVTGRSSTFAKRNLITPMSVIDNGFRGELFAVVWNFGTETQWIEPRERIVQVLPMNNVADLLAWKQVDRLDNSSRAANGFGSSGR